MFQFVFNVCRIVVQEDARCLLVLRMQADYRLCLTCDGIAEVAALNRAKIEICLVVQQVQVADQYFVGISQTFVYFAARVSAVQTFHFDFEVLHVRVGIT